MQITPRYSGTPIIAIPSAPGEQLAPLVRQRRRLGALLATLDDEAWATQSRCAAWSVRDVVSHLADVNGFWQFSVSAGIAGDPTRLLEGFDPAGTPLQMVSSSRAQAHRHVLDRFTTSNDSFIALMEDLGDHDWAKIAECPAGHLPIGLVAAHALWDSWIHERDIAVPLGIACPTEADEVAVSLTYAAALGPALALLTGGATTGSFAIDAADPTIRFTARVGECVEIIDGLDEEDAAPRLRGSAAQLLEAVSLRAPLPASAPPAWHDVLHGLSAAFDVPMTDPTEAR